MRNLKQVRVAIIGQGRSGRDIHAATVSKLPEMYKIVAISDPLEERRARAVEELGCDVHVDYKEFFARDDIDLIVNATPSHMHVPVSLECMENGFNVLCEKPLARWVADVDKLIETSKRTGKTLAIFQQSRFSPALQQIRRIIDSGDIGRAVQVSIKFNGFARRWDWQTLQEKNGGNLLNTGPHPVDQALQLYGADVMPEVVCLMDQANSFGDAEDFVKIILHGHGRPAVEVEISSCDAYPGHAYQVQGTKGGIQGSTSQLEWRYYKPEEAPERHLVTEPLSREDGTPTYCGEELTWYEENWEPGEQETAFGSMGIAFYRMLHDTLANGKPLTVTPQEVRMQIAVMEQCFNQNPRFAEGHRF